MRKKKENKTDSPKLMISRQKDQPSHVSYLPFEELLGYFRTIIQNEHFEIKFYKAMLRKI